MSELSIVMYHYVRDLRRSRYPEIKGLDVALFREQLAYFKKHYRVISAYDLMDAVEDESPLPPRALMLTFDDGYVDHFAEVFPLLHREKLPGCFFPPARAVEENLVLDVNKIHFVLASVEDKDVLVDYIYRALDEARTEYQLQPNEFYWNKCGVEGRYDPPAVMFVKRTLQRDLPLQLRRDITNRLFTRFVSSDEASFSKELYMSLDQLSCLQSSGMYVGSHGFNHYWLDAIPQQEQEVEIDQSLKFLERVGSSSERWIMCFPYGGYNESLLS
ncbi:MAG: polysaccharide deacetylase family protein, partial [Deltaproteobacteria bacterium]|nr:polysaccharide deacetylase family protein [Deltaproteobacteria bacterium]